MAWSPFGLEFPDGSDLFPILLLVSAMRQERQLKMVVSAKFSTLRLTVCLQESQRTTFYSWKTRTRFCHVRCSRTLSTEKVACFSWSKNVEIAQLACEVRSLPLKWGKAAISLGWKVLSGTNKLPYLSRVIFKYGTRCVFRRHWCCWKKAWVFVSDIF
jgi:hypothetical protein